MYFVQGLPRQFRGVDVLDGADPANASFIDLRLSDRGDLLAALTRQQLLIWSGDQVAFRCLSLSLSLLRVVSCGSCSLVPHCPASLTTRQVGAAPRHCQQGTCLEARLLDHRHRGQSLTQSLSQSNS